MTAYLRRFLGCLGLVAAGFSVAIAGAKLMDWSVHHVGLGWTFVGLGVLISAFVALDIHPSGRGPG